MLYIFEILYFLISTHIRTRWPIFNKKINYKNYNNKKNILILECYGDRIKNKRIKI